MRGLSLPVRRGSVVWPGGMLLLYFHHATAVDLCNRDRNPSTDGVPNRTASYSVTRLAQNSSRLQPESRSIGHKTRPSLPPRYCLSLPLPRLCQTRACNRISTSFRKQSTDEKSDIQRSHLQSARVILHSGYFSSTRPALYFFFCMAMGIRNSVPAAERIQLRNAFWLKFLASFRARLTDSKHAPSWVSNSFLFQIYKRNVGSDW
jgi:hypothetical protein